MVVEKVKKRLSRSGNVIPFNYYYVIVLYIFILLCLDSNKLRFNTTWIFEVFRCPFNNFNSSFIIHVMCLCNILSVDIQKINVVYHIVFKEVPYFK